MMSGTNFTEGSEKHLPPMLYREKQSAFKVKIEVLLHRSLLLFKLYDLNTG